MDKNIGNNLKLLRQDESVSQEVLASKIGICRQTLSEIELGRRAMKVRELVKVCEFFDVDYKYLIDEKN